MTFYSRTIEKINKYKKKNQKSPKYLFLGEIEVLDLLAWIRYCNREIDDIKNGMEFCGLKIKKMYSERYFEVGE